MGDGWVRTAFDVFLTFLIASGRDSASLAREMQFCGIQHHPRRGTGRSATSALPGRGSVSVHVDRAAVRTLTRTEWRVEWSDFQGVLPGCL